MCRVDFVPVLLTDRADIFSVREEGESSSEFQKFYIQFKDTEDRYLSDDLNRIIAALNSIGKNGALERETKPEGNYTDRVCALPLLSLPRNKKQHGTLRIYCIRVSEKLFILGGGGLKTTQTYEEDEELKRHVSLLQIIDKQLWELENDGHQIEQEIYNLVIDID